MDDILYIRTQVAEEVIYGGNLDPDFEPHVETEQQIGSLVIQTYEVQLTKGLVIIYQGGRVNMRGGAAKKYFGGWQNVMFVLPLPLLRISLLYPPLNRTPPPPHTTPHPGPHYTPHSLIPPPYSIYVHTYLYRYMYIHTYILMEVLRGWVGENILSSKGCQRFSFREIACDFSHIGLLSLPTDQ